MTSTFPRTHRRRRSGLGTASVPRWLSWGCPLQAVGMGRSLALSPHPIHYRLETSPGDWTFLPSSPSLPSLGGTSASGLELGAVQGTKEGSRHKHPLLSLDRTCVL